MGCRGDRVPAPGPVMKCRRCQYCHDQLGWLASLLRLYVTCSNCAYRMSMGTSPRRPPVPEEKK